MSDDQDTTTAEPESTPAATATAPVNFTEARKFVYNGMQLTDVDASMSPAQIRDLWAGTYPELNNAKVKGPEKDDSGAQVYTFVQNIGKLG
jgi:PRTRC genetic system protein C